MDNIEKQLLFVWRGVSINRMVFLFQISTADHVIYLNRRCLDMQMVKVITKAGRDASCLVKVSLMLMLWATWARGVVRGCSVMGIVSLSQIMSCRAGLASSQIMLHKQDDARIDPRGSFFPFCFARRMASFPDNPVRISSDVAVGLG